MKSIVSDLIMIALGFVLAFSLTRIALEDVLPLSKDEWRCVEYMPGSAECAVYERVGYEKAE